MQNYRIKSGSERYTHCIHLCNYKDNDLILPINSIVKEYDSAVSIIEQILFKYDTRLPKDIYYSSQGLLCLSVYPNCT